MDISQKSNEAGWYLFSCQTISLRKSLLVHSVIQSSVYNVT
jgi:hypothetical protein